MSRTSAITNLPLPGWGRIDLASSAPPARRARTGRWSGAGELVAAVALLVGWAVLWTFFVAGVVEPAAALGARAAHHPSLEPPALLDARPGAAPGPVDTNGRAP